MARLSRSASKSDEPSLFWLNKALKQGMSDKSQKIKIQVISLVLSKFVVFSYSQMIKDPKEFLKKKKNGGLSRHIYIKGL